MCHLKWPQLLLSPTPHMARFPFYQAPTTAHFSPLLWPRSVFYTHSITHLPVVRSNAHRFNLRKNCADLALLGLSLTLFSRAGSAQEVASRASSQLQWGRLSCWGQRDGPCVEALCGTDRCINPSPRAGFVSFYEALSLAAPFKRLICIPSSINASSLSGLSDQGLCTIAARRAGHNFEFNAYNGGAGKCGASGTRMDAQLFRAWIRSSGVLSARLPVQQVSHSNAYDDTKMTTAPIAKLNFQFQITFC